MRTKKRFVSAVAAIATLGLVAAACGGDDGDSTDTTPAPDTTPTTDTAAETTIPEIACPTRDGDEPVRVGLLFDVTGRGDKSFNDAAAAGLDRAKAELDIEATESTPTGDADRAERLNQLIADGYNVIVAVGFLWTDTVQAAAAANPEVAFGIIDGFVPVGNVASLGFSEQEGSYLVGVAAGLKTQTGKVGFIGGVEIDLIKRFEAGFAAGVEAAKPGTEVLVQYITQPPDFSGFNDPAKAKEIAGAMYGDGADIIYSAAGGSGLGAFEAAKEAGAPGEVWAIGVDSDQATIIQGTYPDQAARILTSMMKNSDQYNLVGPDLQPYILTSMLKRVDVATFEFIKAFYNGEAACGPQTFDLAAEGVGYSTSGGFVDDIAAQIDEFAAKITSGEIEVPAAP